MKTSVSSINWSTLSGKPSTHTHTWDSITGKPSTYTPSTHYHTWDSITSKPSSYAPSAHTHDDLYYTEYEINSNFQRLIYHGTSILSSGPAIAANGVFSKVVDNPSGYKIIGGNVWISGAGNVSVACTFDVLNRMAIIRNLTQSNIICGVAYLYFIAIPS